MAKLADALNKEQVKKMYDSAKPYVKRENTKLPGNKFERRLPNGLPAETRRFPEWVNRITLLARNNAEFKRLLSLLLIELHKEAGDIGNDAKCYIKFNFNKYSVKVNGLLTEYSMKTKLFVTAAAAAIVAFDQYAQHTLASYVNNEFDENPLNDKDLEKANELVSKINVIPTTPVEEDANEE